MDQRLKHLEFLQSVISRMNSNSFLIKGWMITLVSALFALAAKDAEARYVFITYAAVPAFWLLDAFYLSQERQYRDLYNDVRSRTDATIDFNMDASAFNRGRNTWLASAFSSTLFALYPVVLAITVLVTFVLG